jgi:hypothetical protein
MAVFQYLVWLSKRCPGLLINTLFTMALVVGLTALSGPWLVGNAVGRYTASLPGYVTWWWSQTVQGIFGPKHRV